MTCFERFTKRLGTCKDDMTCVERNHVTTKYLPLFVGLSSPLLLTLDQTGAQIYFL